MQQLARVEREARDARLLGELDDEHRAFRRALLRERYAPVPPRPAPRESPSLGAQRLAELAQLVDDDGSEL